MVDIIVYLFNYDFHIFLIQSIVEFNISLDWERLKMTIILFNYFQENFLAVMRKNTKHLSGQQRGRFLRVLM